MAPSGTLKKIRTVGYSLDIQQTVNVIGYWIFVEYSTCSEVHWILDIEYSSGGRQGRRVGERGIMAPGGMSTFLTFI